MLNNDCLQALEAVKKKIGATKPKDIIKKLSEDKKKEINNVIELINEYNSNENQFKYGQDAINYSILRDPKITSLLCQDGVLEYFCAIPATYDILYYGLKYGLEQVKYIQGTNSCTSTNTISQMFEKNTVPFLKKLSAFSSVKINTDINLDEYIHNKDKYKEKVYLIANQLALYRSLGGKDDDIGIKKHHYESYNSKFNESLAHEGRLYYNYHPFFIKIGLLDSEKKQFLCKNDYRPFTDRSVQNQLLSALLEHGPKHFVYASLLRIEQDIGESLKKRKDKMISAIDKLSNTPQVSNNLKTELDNLKSTFNNIDYTKEESLPQLIVQLAKTHKSLINAQNLIDRKDGESFMNTFIDIINYIYKSASKYLNKNLESYEEVASHVDKVVKKLEKYRLQPKVVTRLSLGKKISQLI